MSLPSGRTWEQDLKALGVKGAEMFVNMPQAVIQMLTTPLGLEFISFQLGIHLTETALKKGLEKVIAKSGAYLAELAAETASAAGAATAAAAVAGTIAERAVMEATVVETVAEIAEVLSDSVDIVTSVLTIVQVLGMFIDSIDPDGFNQMLDADMLDQIKVTFDNAVNSQLLMGHNGIPVEYYAEYLLMDTAGDDELAKADVKKSYQYQQEYIDSLDVNAFGEKISWDLGNLIAPVPTETDFQKLMDIITLDLANQNTVAAQFIKDHWVKILIVAVLLLVIFFSIK